MLCAEGIQDKKKNVSNLVLSQYKEYSSSKQKLSIRLNGVNFNSRRYISMNINVAF